MPSQISNRAVLRPRSVLPMPSRQWASVPQSFGPTARAEVLAALALVDRIDHQGRHAVQRQQRAHRLVGSCPLPSLACPQGTRTPGQGGDFRIAAGQEEQGGHEMLGLALEDHLLHAVAVAADRAGDLRIQRGPSRQSADRLQELLPQPRLVGGDLRGGLAGFVLLLPAFGGLIGLARASSGASWRRVRDVCRRQIEALFGGGNDARTQHAGETDDRSIVLHDSSPL